MDDTPLALVWNRGGRYAVYDELRRERDERAHFFAPTAQAEAPGVSTDRVTHALRTAKMWLRREPREEAARDA